MYPVVGFEPDIHGFEFIFLPKNLSIPTVEAVNPEPLKANALFTSNGVTMTSDVKSCLYAIIQLFHLHSSKVEFYTHQCFLREVLK
jgi:hypothetical protein